MGLKQDIKDKGTVAIKAKPKVKAEKVQGLDIVSLQPALAEIERMIQFFRDDMSFTKGLRVTPIIQTRGRANTKGHFHWPHYTLIRTATVATSYKFAVNLSCYQL